MRETTYDARTVAHTLGGDVAGRNEVLAPGPGHSRKDRSLAIKLDPKAPDGFVVNSHCGDDWKTCRDYVRSKLGLPSWQPGDFAGRARLADARQRRVDPAIIKQVARYQHLIADTVSLEAAWVELNNSRPTPEATIEAIKHAVRTRGMAALKEPETHERMSRCDQAALDELRSWSAKMTRAGEGSAR
jgi:hypothetical protein